MALGARRQDAGEAYAGPPNEEKSAERRTRKQP